MGGQIKSTNLKQEMKFYLGSEILTATSAVSLPVITKKWYAM
jgi:hypothetical protein